MKFFNFSKNFQKLGKNCLGTTKKLKKSEKIYFWRVRGTTPTILENFSKQDGNLPYRRWGTDLSIIFPRRIKISWGRAPIFKKILEKSGKYLLESSFTIINSM